MKFIGLLLGLLLAAPAEAHDFWIEPSSWTAAAGQLVSVRLRVGASFIGDPVPRDPALIRQFAVLAGGTAEPVPGISGNDPAGLFRASGRCSVIAYESGVSDAELTPEKFAQYVRDESLAAQVPVAPRSAVVDHFSRSAAALIAGDGNCLAQLRRAPLSLQLVLLADPFVHSDLTVSLLMRGKPLPGVTVIAFPRRQPMKQQRVVTDAGGRAALKLDVAGPWLVKAVQIEAQPDGAFRSRWASLTFAR